MWLTMWIILFIEIQTEFTFKSVGRKQAKQEKYSFSICKGMTLSNHLRLFLHKKYKLDKIRKNANDHRTKLIFFINRHQFIINCSNLSSVPAFSRELRPWYKMQVSIGNSKISIKRWVMLEIRLLIE